MIFFRSCPLSFLRWGLIGLKLADEAGLGGQQATGIHLSPVPWYEAVFFLGGSADLTKVFMLVLVVFYQLIYLPSPLLHNSNQTIYVFVL